MENIIDFYLAYPKRMISLISDTYGYIKYNFVSNFVSDVVCKYSYLYYLNIPRGISIPIEGDCGFALHETMFFKKSVKYTNMWIPTRSKDSADIYSNLATKKGIVEVPKGTHVSVISIIRTRGRYYVLARFDQFLQIFDVLCLFRDIKPLILKTDVW